MIYYFSGTGNSLAVAQGIAMVTGQQLSDTVEPTLHGEDDDAVGFVCPVYAWGIPRTFKQTITRWMELVGTGQIPTPDYIFLVLTCGDDIGMTDKEVGRLLKKSNFRLDACFSVAMPNTYICLPGFDIDSKELQQQKLKSADERIAEIARHIHCRTRRLTRVVRGAVPRLKSYVLRPLFNAFLTGDKRFHTTDACNGCGHCQRICPLHNISANTDGKPQWNGRCADCLRCYHLCPRHAIHYAGRTMQKGQYHHKALHTKPSHHTDGQQCGKQP